MTAASESISMLMSLMAFLGIWLSMRLASFAMSLMGMFA